jgi:hypothetical protein
MADFIQGTKPKGVFTEKDIKIADQIISLRHFDIFDFLGVWHFNED